MRKYIYFLVLLTIFICNISLTELYSLALNPSITIVNNKKIDYISTINNINSEIDKDNLFYIFNKDNIKENLTNFKKELIYKINELIQQSKNTQAKELLDEYSNLFPNDYQLETLNNYIETNMNKNNLVKYNGNIEILSFRPLISYPKLIFNENNSSSLRADENNITIYEFEKILMSLYENNYILISPNLINEMLTTKHINLPPNKKPLILMLENTEYNSKINGCVDKLIINNDKISTYTPKRSINERISDNNDFITILDNFIDNHPSFSFNNAKALICIDGSHGIFGYNTQKNNATSKYEIKKAIEIINHLNTAGYSFASSGYNTSIKDSYVQFASGLNTWNNNILPIVESCNIFFLNENIDAINGDISYHADLLNTYGYTIIIGTNMDNIIEYNEKLNNNYITAKKINGKILRYSQDKLSHLFDCEKIYDHLNRHITFNI